MNKTQKILVAVAALYVVLGIVTGIIFYAKGSYIQERADKRVDYEFQPTAEEIMDAVSEDSVSDEEEAEDADDESYEDDYLADDTLSDDSVLEDTVSDDSVSEDSVSDNSLSEDSISENEVKPFVAIGGVANGQYYVYTVNAHGTQLNLRAEPNTNAKILVKLDDMTSGYVLVTGEEWSLVTNGITSGYVLNEYIVLTEIAEEVFPDAYK